MRFRFWKDSTAKFSTMLTAGAIAIVTASLCACSGINDSWEVKGGGFLKYSINGENEIQQELERDDVEIPFIRNRHHYILIKFPAERNKRGEQLSIMVNEPKLGKNAVVANYTWFQTEGSPTASIKGDSNYVSFDQKDDTKWTAYINLQFEDCRSGKCNSNLPPITLKGRLHYWIAEEDQ